MDTKKHTNKLKTVPNLAAINKLAAQAAVTTEKIPQPAAKIKPTSYLIPQEEKDMLRNIQSRLQAYSRRKVSEALIVRALIAKAKMMSDEELVSLIKKVIF